MGPASIDSAIRSEAKNAPDRRLDGFEPVADSGRTLDAYRHDLRGFFQWAAYVVVAFVGGG